MKVKNNNLSQCLSLIIYLNVPKILNIKNKRLYEAFQNLIFMLISITPFGLFIFIFLVIKNTLNQCDSIK